MSRDEMMREAARRTRIHLLVQYGPDPELILGATEEEYQAALSEHARWEANADENHRAAIAEERVKNHESD